MSPPEAAEPGCDARPLALVYGKRERDHDLTVTAAREELKQSPSEWMPWNTIALPWHGWPRPLPRNIIDPAWPKRIVDGHGWVAFWNARNTGFSEARISWGFWPGSESGGKWFVPSPDLHAR